MSRRLLISSILILMVLAFLAGAWISHRFPHSVSSSGGKRILYYVDPMHPSYRSDRPGIAPDCGMPLEPVYAGSSADQPSKSGTSLTPAVVSIAPERLQTIGVNVGVVGRGGEQLLRLTGRVLPDEARTYVINATIDGWITGVGKATTGSIVRKNEVLANFYSPEFLSAVQALLFALNSMDRVQSQPAATNPAQQGQMEQFGINLKQYRDSLRNLGMGEPQINEMIKTRRFMENVDIISPSDGFVVARNVSPGQRFDKGRELYRIADLSRVWITVDTFGAEVDRFRPGMTVKITVPNRGLTLNARVSSVPPQFDPVSRTMKVRLEAANPGYLLRPDMFVDAELLVSMPSMLSIPASALLDSGLKKSVFVERSPGLFEPREVETGRSIGNRVEIVSGLKAGERIAVSGTFLLDSESRMKSTAAGISGTPRQDPVCGMYVDEAKARAAGLTVESGGVTHFFCSVEDKNRFLKNPAAKKPMPDSPAPATAPGPAAKMKKTGHNDRPAPAAQAAPGNEHTGHQMPASMPEPQAPTAHGSGMKHD